MDKYISEFTKQLTLRNLTQKTISGYTQGLNYFLKKCREQIPSLTVQNVQDYIYGLHKSGQSPSYINAQTASIKIFCKTVLDKAWDYTKIPYGKITRRLPVVMSREDITLLIASAESLKHKAILATLYGTGMRPAELSQLKVSDICSREKEKTIRIRNGKGRKERFVMLSDKLLDLLRAYWLTVKGAKSEYLFFGVSPEKPMDPESFGTVFRRTKARAGIKDDSYCYSLRHSFATHLLEDGVDLRSIQAVLGHTSIEVTTIYCRVMKRRIAEIKSPFDSLPPNATK
jgi:site-specific recombinase XerD